MHSDSMIKSIARDDWFVNRMTQVAEIPNFRETEDAINYLSFLFCLKISLVW